MYLINLDSCPTEFNRTVWHFNTMLVGLVCFMHTALGLGRKIFNLKARLLCMNIAFSDIFQQNKITLTWADLQMVLNFINNSSSDTHTMLTQLYICAQTLK